LTQGIAKLEAQLGTPLFERRPDGMVPTDGGTVRRHRGSTPPSTISRRPPAAPAAATRGPNG
jgi:hypothetical protein